MLLIVKLSNSLYYFMYQLPCVSVMWVDQKLWSHTDSTVDQFLMPRNTLSEHVNDCNFQKIISDYRTLYQGIDDNNNKLSRFLFLNNFVTLHNAFLKSSECLWRYSKVFDICLGLGTLKTKMSLQKWLQNDSKKLARYNLSRHRTPKPWAPSQV